MGFLLGILLKGLDFGKMLLGWIWDLLKGIAAFAMAKPWQFATIVLALLLALALWSRAGIQGELETANLTIKDKTAFIEEQDKSLKLYVKALDTEKKNHSASIARSNDAVADLKKTADRALANAQEAKRKAKAEQKRFEEIAEIFGLSNVTTGTAEERIDREQKTNDDFIEAWRKAIR